MRAGGYTLRLLATPRIFAILQALAEGAQEMQGLRRCAGFPAQSTLRSQLGVLEGVNAIEKRRPDYLPSAPLEYSLTGAGRELLAVAEGLQRWLTEAPQGPLELGGDPARAAVKGLVDGWMARMLAPLAGEPLSLTQLGRKLTSVSYPTLARRLETMRLAEQVEEGERTGSGTPYVLRDWLRRGIAPLAVAVRWEHRHEPRGSEPVTREEIGSAMTIVTRLLELPPEPSSICQLAVRVPGGDSRKRPLGSAVMRAGTLVFGPVYPQRKPDAWISGTVEQWFSTVIDGDTRGLRLSGDRDLWLDAFRRLHEIVDQAAHPEASRSPEKPD